MMRLLKLEIERNRWGDDAGKFRGTAKFDGERGTIELNLNEHHIEQMFLACADGIVDVAKAAARMFVQEALANTEAAKQRQIATATIDV
jgi:hypothetical protein